ncbi:hypothetical protein CWB96_07840 [Pseudoalteromonas citrea]|uniref:YcaO domain-containing protein n=1 Tax=Pseudoalteromonas citrea TaxID=43655 RepID=A0A5S3XSY8_9GAMM|nr:YcaO-like family protein [Pseudoalteromonas citrea]TMP41050.1 hypothetical protein CWB97_16030 [Pseudoalteromonas citrea]TMP60116.1 hypothetical protein CWB96_07840 [Pseudoalteromonas citrea]
MLLNYNQSITLDNNTSIFSHKKFTLIIKEDTSYLIKTDINLEELVYSNTSPNKAISTLPLKKRIATLQTLDNLHLKKIIKQMTSKGGNIKPLQEKMVKPENIRTIQYINEINEITVYNSRFEITKIIKSNSELEKFKSCVIRNDPIRYWFERYSNRITHHINHTKNTGDCNNKKIIAKETSPPPAEQDIHKSCDGGYRVKTAHETLELILPHVNNITGIVNKVEEVNCENLPFKTYKAIYQIDIPTFKDPTNFNFKISSLGKGKSIEQAKVSAIAECYERYAAQFQCNDDYIIDSFKNIEHKSIHPNIIHGLSERQKSSYSNNFIYPGKSSDDSYPDFNHSHKHHWSSAISLISKEKKYLPTSFLFANSPYGIKYCSWNSNGCAAGNTKDEAILQGLLELIERDAIAIWWYNKLQFQEINVHTLDQNIVSKIQTSLSTEWDIWFLNITHDFDIPVIACISRHLTTKKFRFGFGCHLKLEVAMERALTELCQLISIGSNHNAPFNFDEIDEHLFLYPKKDKNTTCNISNLEFSNISETLDFCLKKASSLGIDILVKDYNRSEIPLETVKVIAPGMCHIWPQMALDRLYSVPFKLNWVEYKSNELTLNKQKLYI